MKKLLLVMLLMSGYLFGAMNLQTASKAELMTISGIGSKKADAIIKYRKTHKLKSASDLLKVKGIGQGIVNNVTGNVKSNKKLSSTKKSMNKKRKNITKSAKNDMKKKKRQAKHIKNKKMKKTKRQVNKKIKSSKKKSRKKLKM